MSDTIVLNNKIIIVSNVDHSHQSRCDANVPLLICRHLANMSRIICFVFQR